MKTRTIAILVAAVMIHAALGSRPTGPGDIASEFTDTERRLILQHARVKPLPPSPTNRVADDPDAARLGQQLFFDPRLSVNGEVSCATCHDPKLGFADGKPLAEGLDTGRRHTPSLWNVAYNRWFFWDGRADTLWAQALQPIERDIEMGSTRQAAVALVRDDPDLRRAYEKVFGAMPDDVDRIFADLGKALAAYQRRLVARRSPFDEFLEGLADGAPEKLAALSPAARRGLRLFVGKGECRLCHSGPNLSDGEFHDIRVPTRDGGPPTDPGRYDGLRKLLRDPFNAAGTYSDAPESAVARRLERLVRGPDTWGSFKTPSLRNVALSPPYMHLGQFVSLHEVLDYYSTLEGATMSDHHQEITLVPRDFTDAEIADLVEFLHALTDTNVDPGLLVKPGPEPR